MDELYNTVLDAITWQKIENLFEIEAKNFWELYGYEEYHDHAIAYDYIHYINLHRQGFEPNERFARFDFEDKRKQALHESIKLIDKDFYQTETTDVKFVSLSENELNELKKDKDTSNNFESYICVSGFLSQRDNLKESWHAILDHGHDKPVFGFKWPAEDAISIFTKILFEISNLNFDNLGSVSLGDIMAFNAVREIAKESGRLLAHALVLEYPKYLPKVSFVAFSLGNEVVRSCLEELHRLNATHIVNNVYFLAGATTLTEFDADIFDIIEGNITHVYTPSDRILDFYEFSTGESPIGQSELGEYLSILFLLCKHS